MVKKVRVLMSCLSSIASQLWKALFLNDYIRAPTGLSVSSRNYDLPNIQTLGSVLLHQGTNSAVSSGRKIAGLPKRYYQPHLRSNVALGLTGHRTAEPRSESSLRESKSTDGPSVVLSQDDIAALEGLDVRHDGLDWKALYRVSHNWQQGSFIVNRLFDGIFAKRSGKAVRERVWTQQLDRDENSEERREQPSTSSHHPGPVRPMTLVQASPYLIFTASRATNYPQAQPFAAEALPSARVYMADEPSAPHAPHDPTSHEPLCALHSSRLADALSRDAAAQIVARNGIAITEIRINAAPLSPMTASSSKGKGKAGSDVDLPGVMRFLVCYSTGHFVIFRVSLHEDSFVRYVEEYVHDPFAPSQARPHAAESSSTSTDKPPVTVLSAFHSPLLVTCTADFAISIYRIDAPGSASLGEEGSKTKVEFLRELRSFTCHWPACLNLRKLPIIDVDMQRKNGRRRSSSASLGGMSDQSLVRSRSTERRLTRWPAQSILHPEANSTATGSSSTASIAAEAEAECAFRLSIAYSTPMYPASWTIGLQEIVLRLPLSSFSSSSSSTTRPRMIITSRHATAVPTFARTPLDTRGSNIFRPPRPSVEQPLPWRDPRSRMAEVFETSPASRGGTRGKARDRTREGENRVTSVTYDEPFVVVGAQDNLLEVCHPPRSVVRPPPPF